MTHYIAMSGYHGYLPDYVSVHVDYQDAVNDLLQMFYEMSPEQATRLAEDGYFECTSEEPGDWAGVEYLEIQTCDCLTPEVHQED